MITLRKVTKQFNSRKAVSDVTFTTKPGEIIGFLGPNGAGKTTTMRLILGLLKPTSGEVLVNKLEPVRHRLTLLKNIGYLPENNPLYSEMLVGEYLQFIAKVKKAGEVRKIAKEVGLEDVMFSKIEELSRGYKQRVGLTAALLGNPEILILDEPTSGLDPLEQEKIRTLIKKLSKKKTIIFSTHILSEVEDVANKLIIINKGIVVYNSKKPAGRGSVEKLFKKLVK